MRKGREDKSEPTSERTSTCRHSQRQRAGVKDLATDHDERDEPPIARLDRIVRTKRRAPLLRRFKFAGSREGDDVAALDIKGELCRYIVRAEEHFGHNLVPRVRVKTTIDLARLRAS